MIRRDFFMIATQKDTVIIAVLPEINEEVTVSLFDGKFTTHDIEELYCSFLADISAQVTRYPKTRIVIYYSAPSLHEMLENLFHAPTELRLVAQIETGTFYSSVIERLFKSERCKNLLLLLAPHPLVDYHIIEHALHILNLEDDSLVIGTLLNHKPYLLGMKYPHESFLLLEDRGYHDSEELLRKCCSINGLLSPLPSLQVIQTTDDLVILMEKLERLCEARHDYPKRSLSLLRQLEHTLNPA
jgi:hypothetical protein